MPTQTQRIWLTDLHCPWFVTIGVRKAAPKTLDDAIQEAIRLECIHKAIQKSMHKGLLKGTGGGTEETPLVLQGILELKTSQEQNFVVIRGKLDDHEAHLPSLEQIPQGGGRSRQRHCFRCGQLLMIRIETIMLKRGRDTAGHQRFSLYQVLTPTPAM